MEDGMRAACILIVTLVLPLGAAAAEWQKELTMQLRELHDCTLGFLSHVQESKIEGLPKVIAKAHCEDGRAFDVSREHERGLFKITECETQRVC